MTISETEILLCIAACAHLGTLYDLERGKSEEERDWENFDPNDEVLLRSFVLPELLDALRSGNCDTKIGMSKTEMVLQWSLGVYLEKGFFRFFSGKA
jgi:hypothetical protein